MPWRKIYFSRGVLFLIKQSLHAYTFIWFTVFKIHSHTFYNSFSIQVCSTYSCTYFIYLLLSVLCLWVPDAFPSWDQQREGDKEEGKSRKETAGRGQLQGDAAWGEKKAGGDKAGEKNRGGRTTWVNIGGNTTWGSHLNLSFYSICLEYDNTNTAPLKYFFL